MARNALEDGIRISEGSQVASALRGVRGLTQQINTLMGQLIDLQTKWQVGLVSGLYDQQDVDLVNAAVAPWTTALPNGTTFQGAVAAFLASGIGA